MAMNDRTAGDVVGAGDLPDVDGTGRLGSEAPVLETRRISKHYGHVRALSDIDLKVWPGQVVGLVGDNGAGKSTLVNILAGAIQPSDGTILIDGHAVTFRSASDARREGIEAVYQDLALANDLKIWANLFLGREQLVSGPLRWFGWLDKRAMMRRAEEDLKRTKIRIGSVNSSCGALSGGQRQAVAVARGVAWGSRLLLLDEPTAALGVEQQRQVAELVTNVRDQGIPVLLISHNLPQVHDICDRIVVLFQGRKVADLDSRQSSIDDSVRWITGSNLERVVDGSHE